MYSDLQAFHIFMIMYKKILCQEFFTDLASIAFNQSSNKSIWSFSDGNWRSLVDKNGPLNGFDSRGEAVLLFELSLQVNN